MPKTDSGRRLEKRIEDVVAGRGYRRCSDKTSKRQVELRLEGRPRLVLPLYRDDAVYAPQFAFGAHVMGGRKVHDIVAVSTRWPLGLFVEAKYNEEGGSVDDKFPCVVDTYVRLGRPFYVVWGGAGTSTNAIRYLVEKSREYGNFKGVGNMSEFVDFCGREL